MTEEEDRKGARDARVGEEGADSLRFQEPPPHVNDIARRVIEAAVEVHRHLGPGYAESVYEKSARDRAWPPRHALREAGRVPR